MDTVTYPHPDVQRFMRDHFAPVRLDVTRATAEAECYHPVWTPTLLILDADGTERYRLVGYVPPKEFQADLGVGLAKAYIGRGAWPNAIAHLREVASHFSDTWAAPEAQYWLGVARYKSDGDAGALIAEWNTLLDRWPDSRWAQSAGFIRS